MKSTRISATMAMTMLSGAVLSGVLFSGSALAEEVRVYNWSDYIDTSLIKTFEKETGIKVVYDVFDSNDILETKLLAGRSGYDIVVPSGTFLQRQIQIGIFQELDFAKLPNRKHLWDVIQKRSYKFDPGGKYSINYMWGSTGLGVNIDKVKAVLGDDAPIDSLSLIFDPKYMKKLKECGVHFLDSSSEMIPAALAYLGEFADSQDPKIIAKSQPVLAGVHPYVQKYHNSEYISALASGDICVAFGWSGDILQAQNRAVEAKNGVNIVYHAPKEGALMWFDQMAIPADAPNPAAAHKFLNFMMKPENIAKASNYLYYANGNLGSQKFLDKELLNNPSIYPTEEILKRLYITRPWPAKVQRKVTRLWTRVKSGQ